MKARRCDARTDMYIRRGILFSASLLFYVIVRATLVPPESLNYFAPFEPRRRSRAATLGNLSSQSEEDSRAHARVNEAPLRVLFFVAPACYGLYSVRGELTTARSERFTGFMGHRVNGAEVLMDTGFYRASLAFPSQK